MSAAFFGLAFLAALNPKLLAVDLLLIDNRRPRTMFLCLLAGGLGLAIGIGLLDVLVLHADAVKAQGQASAGLDLALGVPTSKSSTATQVIAVVIFAIIEFALVIVPYLFLELRPESTKRQLKVAQGWITGHARQLIAIALIIAGTYMTITGLIRLA